jgi:hypothetical protein
MKKGLYQNSRYFCDGFLLCLLWLEQCWEWLDWSNAKLQHMYYVMLWKNKIIMSFLHTREHVTLYICLGYHIILLDIIRCVALFFFWVVWYSYFIFLLCLNTIKISSFFLFLQHFQFFDFIVSSNSHIIST